jgi:hypothetical protein
MGQQLGTGSAESTFTQTIVINSFSQRSMFDQAKSTQIHGVLMCVHVEKRARN